MSSVLSPNLITCLLMPNHLSCVVLGRQPFTFFILDWLYLLISCCYDGARWWIVSIYWQHESPEHPVPENYLYRRSAVPSDIPQTHALLSQICQQLRQEAPAHNGAQCKYSKFDECAPIGQATAARRAVRNLKGLPKGRAALPG